MIARGSERFPRGPNYYIVRCVIKDYTPLRAGSDIRLAGSALKTAPEQSSSGVSFLVRKTYFMYQAYPIRSP